MTTPEAIVLVTLLMTLALAAEPVVEPGADWVVEESSLPAIESAIALLRAGEMDQAATAFAALDAASEQPQITYLHALAAYEGGSLDTAQEAAFGVEAPEYAPLLNLRGLILADVGRGPEALAELSAAEEVAGTDRALRARILLNRGLIEADSGQFGAAETSLARAATLAREVGDDAVVQGAVDNLARIASLTGRGGARDVLGAVVEHLRKGDVASAEAALREDAGTDRRSLARQALARASIARVQGQMEPARIAAEESLRIAREAGLVRERLASLGDIAALYMAMERPALARVALDEALGLVEGTHFKVREIGLRIQSGLLASDEDNILLARAEADRALTLLMASSQPVAQARLAELQARIALLEDNTATAQTRFTESYDQLSALGYSADAARIAVDSVRRTDDDVLRAAWADKALASFEAAGDPSGPAFVAMSEGLLLASRDDIGGALEAFVRASEAAEVAGPRAARVQQIASENAAVAMAALGHNTEGASEMGLEEVVRRRGVFDDASAAYEVGRTAYDEGRYSEARSAFERAQQRFMELGEVDHGTTARRALAWATYQDALRTTGIASYPFYEEIEQEAIQVGDPELAVRARVSRAMIASELEQPSAASQLLEAARQAEGGGYDVLAGQVWAEVALKPGELADRAMAARKAAEHLTGEELGTHALYAVAVDAFNAEDYGLARILAGEAGARGGALATAVTELEEALVEVGE
ncbi:MAG: tetratricopeptide (TPR) repeat protein [Bradymonadia bacterium]